MGNFNEKRLSEQQNKNYSLLLQVALNCCLQDVQRISEFHDDLYSTFSNEDGSVLDSANLVPLIFQLQDSAEKGNLPTKDKWGINLFGIHRVITDVLSDVRGQALQLVEKKTPQQAVKLGDSQVFLNEIDTVVAQIEEYLAEDDIPEKITREELAVMSVPLSSKDIARMDEIFASPESPEDIGFAFLTTFYAVMSAKQQSALRDIYKDLGKTLKVFAESSNILSITTRITKEYFSYWRNQAYLNFFDSDAPENIFADKPLLGVILAALEIKSQTVLPENFANMLEGGMFGELDTATRKILMKEYEMQFSEFAKKIARVNIYEKWDDQLNFPYKLARKATLSDQEALLGKVMPYVEQVEGNPMKVVIDNFSHLQKRLGKSIHTVGFIDDAQIALDAGTYCEDKIDLLLTAEDVAVVFQVQKLGDAARIIGIPEETSPEVTLKVINWMLEKLLDYARDTLQLFSEPKAKPVVNQPMSRRCIKDPLDKKSTATTPIEVSTPRPLKRKTMRRIGLLDDTNRESDTTESNKPTRKYEVIFSDNFRNELVVLPVNIQALAREAVRKIERGEKSLEKLHYREVDTKVFKLQIGKKYRIALIEMGSGKLSAVKIDTREDVYRSLTRQIYSLTKKL